MAGRGDTALRHIRDALSHRARGGIKGGNIKGGIRTRLTNALHQVRFRFTPYQMTIPFCDYRTASRYDDTALRHIRDALSHRARGNIVGGIRTRLTDALHQARFFVSMHATVLHLLSTRFRICGIEVQFSKRTASSAFWCA